MLLFLCKTPTLSQNTRSDKDVWVSWATILDIRVIRKQICSETGTVNGLKFVALSLGDRIFWIRVVTCRFVTAKSGHGRTVRFQINYGGCNLGRVSKSFLKSLDVLNLRSEVWKCETSNLRQIDAHVREEPLPECLSLFWKLSTLKRKNLLGANSFILEEISF